MSQIRSRLIAAAAIVTALGAGAAHAGDVHWTIGINAPLGHGGSIGTVFSNGRAAPVIVAAAPLFYEPTPVVLPAHPVYRPRFVVAPPPYVVRAPIWVADRWVGNHHGQSSAYGHRQGWGPQRHGGHHGHGAHAAHDGHYGHGDRHGDNGHRGHGAHDGDRSDRGDHRGPPMREPRSERGHKQRG